MPNFLNLEEAFTKCKKEGKLIPISEIDLEKIKSSILIAQGDFDAAQVLKKNIANDCMLWNSVYKLHYDALHSLVEAFLRFDKIKSENHQCLFAYLCEKHPELEFDWDFFEKIRTKRNGINYYGTPVNEIDWKEIELQLTLYFDGLKKEIGKKTNNLKG
jgi:hypothetical protein